MKRPFSRPVLLSVTALLLAGCGAAATLPPQEETGALSGRLSEAVWYAEKGDHTGLALATDNSILVLPPGDDSTYVNGAFSIDVPDLDVVEFSSQVVLSAGAKTSVVFRAYVQDGADFPKLAETTVAPDSPPGDFVVNLASFRGRSLLLILAVSTPDGTPLSTSALWIDPRVLTP